RLVSRDTESGHGVSKDGPVRAGLGVPAPRVHAGAAGPPAAAAPLAGGPAGLGTVRRAPALARGALAPGPPDVGARSCQGSQMWGTLALGPAWGVRLGGGGGEALLGLF